MLPAIAQTSDACDTAITTNDTKAPPKGIIHTLPAKVQTLSAYSIVIYTLPSKARSPDACNTVVITDETKAPPKGITHTLPSKV